MKVAPWHASGAPATIVTTSAIDCVADVALAATASVEARRAGHRHVRRRTPGRVARRDDANRHRREQHGIRVRVGDGEEDVASGEARIQICGPRRGRHRHDLGGHGVGLTRPTAARRPEGTGDPSTEQHDAEGECTRDLSIDDSLVPLPALRLSRRPVRRDVVICLVAPGGGTEVDGVLRQPETKCARSEKDLRRRGLTKACTERVAGLDRRRFRILLNAVLQPCSVRQTISSGGRSDPMPLRGTRRVDR